jgi:type I restriction enzyme R subunit
MTSEGFTEDELVEQPAIALLEELGWEHVYCYDEEWQGGESILGRESKADVLLVDRLRPKLEAFNPEVPSTGIDQAIEELRRDRSRLSSAGANQDVYELLKDGVKITLPDEDGGGDRVETVSVIDWEHPEDNDFLICSQMWITGELHTRRPDLLGFVNGLPLVFMELKATHRRLENAYNDNLRDYKDTIPHLFWYNAFVVLSNGSESKVGSVTAGWEHFAEWKRVESEEEPPRVSLETTLRGTCNKSRLIDIVENFTIFMEDKGGTSKIVAKYHQRLGVNNTIEALQQTRNPDQHIERDGKGQLGVFWHTQGSGKSISMVFFAQKVLRKIPGNWTFVLVTDRQELDDQIYRTFQSSGVVTEGHVQANSSYHLRQLLSEDHRFVFTLIHKFRTEEPGDTHPVLSERDDVIVITDEAHRSQYDTLALNMRNALPNALYLAFTGTPLIEGEEEETKEVFGDYVSVYDFKQSIEDKATVPLYYENRIPEVQLTNESLNEDIYSAIETADLDEASEKKLERELGTDYHLITRDDRLEKVAKDIVDHFPSRGFKGEGMVVCIDKATAIRMYNKVSKYWDRKIRELEQELASTPPEKKEDLRSQLEWMKSVDMAVVVSQGQNEIAEMEEKGLDIRPHRKRMNEEDLESKFKDRDDDLRLVFVCAMWMTGFDVPSCSTIYIDKPMRNHNLMQTIARANRVYPNKENGLIVDYVGVFRKLEKALSIYGSGRGRGGDEPVKDKEALLEQLEDGLEDAEDFCNEHEVDVEAIQEASGFKRVALLDEARDKLVKNDKIKAEFLSHASYVNRLFKAILPDKEASQYSVAVSTFGVLAEKIKALDPEPDIDGVMDDIEQILDDSIAAEGYVIDVPTGPEDDDRFVDISGIDFEKLEEAFGKHKAAAAQRARSIIQRRVQSLVAKNRTRMDYLERFETLIDDYNAGSLNQEEFLRKLQEFSEELDMEEERHIREGLSEEELAVFDLLTKPDVELTREERDQVKQASRNLISRLKEEKLKIDWRKHQQTRADVRVTIERTLDNELPVDPYDQKVFMERCNAVYQHVSESYAGPDENVYAAG